MPSALEIELSKDHMESIHNVSRAVRQCCAIRFFAAVVHQYFRTPQTRRFSPFQKTAVSQKKQLRTIETFIPQHLGFRHLLHGQLLLLQNRHQRLGL